MEINQIKEYMTANDLSNSDISKSTGINRSSISQYLNGKKETMPIGTVQRIESAFEELMGDIQPLQKKHSRRRSEFILTADAEGVLAVCKCCQDYMGFGVIIGRSGFGKSYSLRYYAKSPRVAYVECNESMSARDLIKAIERALSLPYSAGTIDDRLDTVKEYFNTNPGYLLVIDEADKLITKYTQKKAEILRNIYDQSDMGMILAGEPMLEKMIRQYIPRLANRIDYKYELCGLDSEEVIHYIEDYDFDEEAQQELIRRATNERIGCFRLLSRTVDNVLRLGNEACLDITSVQRASRMMLL